MQGHKMAEKDAGLTGQKSAAVVFPVCFLRYFTGFWNLVIGYLFVRIASLSRFASME